MYSRVTFLIIIALVCISILGTVILVKKFTREEYQPFTIPPPLPEIPKEETTEILFQYSPEVYRDPFKMPINVKVAIEKTKEIALIRQPQPTPIVTSESKPIKVPPIKETKPQKSSMIEEVKPEKEIKKVDKRELPEVEKVESKEELPSKIKLTGVIYDDAPFVIIEFENKSGIFEEGDKLIEDLIVKKIYPDSVDLKWKGKVYNIKLGG